jgi:GTP1/Obg family GTP-binding protein
MRVLDQLRRLRNRLSDTYSGHAKKIRTAKSSLDIRENFAVASDEFMRVLGDDKARDALATARKCFALLRRLNTIDPRVPTVALVGAPNVGKSSLVRELSTGRPEVQHYPFTTRSVSCGHVVIPGEHGDHSCQVTDTPGLLNRPDSQRKKVEMLTLSVLEHLPSLVVIFVLDPSGHCGTSLEDQLAIRQELRWRYHKLVPGHRWFDVATKSDVWRRTPEEAEALAQREAALEEALMIKAQAERLGVSEARVRAEMAAVEQGPLAEEAKAVAQAWRDETLSALGRLERHGDWTIEGETGLVRDGAGEAIGHVDEEGKMEIWVSEENEMNEVNKYDVAEDVDDEENVGLSEAEGEEEVWAELEALAELEAEAAANADAEEDVEDFLSDFESGSPSLATTLTGTEAAVQQQQQQQQSSPSRVSRKTRKATTTSMPVDPSSLSVGPSWSLAETLAQLPPRPRDFVDDDTHMYEVSVVGADAYRETQAEERRRKHMQIRRMFGLYDAATDAEADDADAKDDIEMGANANKESDVALPRWARTRRVEAARDVGLGLSECPTVNVSTLPLAEDDTTPSVADELITDETVPAAVLQGKAELDELRGALGWELRELCVEEEEQQSRMEAGERIEVE